MISPWVRIPRITANAEEFVKPQSFNGMRALQHTTSYRYCKDLGKD
jgi:hypothetical protein